MDIFLKLNKNKTDLFKLMKECNKKAFKVFIDILSPNKVTRESLDISFNECLNIFKNNKDRMHWVFILRESYFGVWNENEEITKYWEVGGCTLARPGGDVFLFMYMTIEEGLKIQQTYDLKPWDDAPRDLKH